MPDVAILIPMLGRPHRVLPLLESIHHASPEARVLFCVSPHDTAVQAEIDLRGGERITVPYQVGGDYARKINAGFDATDEPLIFTGADDLHFHEGWMKRAASYLEPGVGVVGTNDLGNSRVMEGEHSTHSLVTREYVERYGIRDEPGVDVPGKVLCEIYPHEYVDDEFVETAKMRQAYRHASDAVVEHLHPNWNKGQPAPNGLPDKLYPQQETRMRAGRPLYQKRRHLWA